MTVAAAAVMAAAVVVLFVVAAFEDAATGRVTIRRSQVTTAAAVVGFGLISAATGSWERLLSAALGATIVVAVQAIPYWLQSTSDTSRDINPPQDSRSDWIGKADLRLGLPFGWTLGWFGVEVAVGGFVVALAVGVLFSLATRRRSVPFVPFLAIGLAVGAVFGVLDLAATEG